MAAQRLRQTLNHLSATGQVAAPLLAVAAGPTTPPLVDLTMGDLLALQARPDRFGGKTALTIPWTDTRWTYAALDEAADQVARGLVAAGVGAGDAVGVMAGNCQEYVAAFFGATRIGAVVVVLNSAYTAGELLNALRHIDCKLLFITPTIGRHDNAAALAALAAAPPPSLARVVILRGEHAGFGGFAAFVAAGADVPLAEVRRRAASVRPGDVCNVQFTSGSTGRPKAAMLTHHNLVNNSRFIAGRLNFTSADILCCPPPLFHCFGLVLGLLACVSAGAAAVYPGDSFHAGAVVRALSEEQCTALHGVPTMFDAVLAAMPAADSEEGRQLRRRLRLRTGIIAGAPVPRPLMRRLVDELGMGEFTSSYGLTEAAPTVFNAHTTDSVAARLQTVGRLLPHARAKVVDPRTLATVPVGVRGELWVAGYQLFRGYYRDPEQTAATTVRERSVGGGSGGGGRGKGESVGDDNTSNDDSNDTTVWLRTGDEAAIDAAGYCAITGRFKDLIIRGGENIYPLEIEERLMTHPAVARAAVVGAPDPRYGEVVAAFIELADSSNGPGGGLAQTDLTTALQAWTREALGRHKAPQYVWVLGPQRGGGLGGEGTNGKNGATTADKEREEEQRHPEVGELPTRPLLPPGLPLTASGKVQKQVLRELARGLV